MIIFAYDFETSGLPLFKEPSDDPRQPHIVQAAAALVDSTTRKVLTSLNLIARPDGWKIPEDVAAVHGISTEHATAVGIDEATVVRAMHALWRNAHFRIAHNESFDARIMRIALKRYRSEIPGVDDSVHEVWKKGRAECTARRATPYCALPPTERMLMTGRVHHKTPKLSEAYRHFTGRDLDGAHSALADVRACLAVYWAIEDLESSEYARSPRTAAGHG